MSQRYLNPFRNGSVTSTALVHFMALLPEVTEGNMTDTQLRKQVIAEVREATGKSEGTVGAAYTTAKREAKAQGHLPENFGRGEKSNPVTIRQRDVRRVSDQKIVHTNVTEAQALALIDKASASKSAALELAPTPEEVERAQAKAKREAERAEAKAQREAEREAKRKEREQAKQAKAKAKAKASKATKTQQAENAS